MEGLYFFLSLLSIALLVAYGVEYLMRNTKQ